MTPTPYYDCDSSGFIQLLKDRIQDAGSQKAVAQACGISEQYLSDVLRGKREPGWSLYNALGFERHIVYLKVGGEKAA